MRLETLPYDLTVCKVASVTDIDLGAEICFVGKTDEELSLVCRTEDAPAHTLAREDGWRAFRVAGVLDFSLTGILARLSAVLAAEKIGIFAVSTYNTDYILVKREDFARATDALARSGCEIPSAGKENP
ncbi:MAG: ACT domain-containing protein [Clostridia bacterium]|nr:ACT domain-containing protein [Clostridia bacterium]